MVYYIHSRVDTDPNSLANGWKATKILQNGAAKSSVVFLFYGTTRKGWFVLGNDALSMAQSPTLPESVGLHYTLQEAAALLQIPVADLERAIASNTLLCVHQYGRKLIAAEHLDAYRVQRHLVSPSVPDGALEPTQ